MCICVYVYANTQNIIQFFKHEILRFVTTWIDFEGIMLSEISQIGKDKYCRI